MGSARRLLILDDDSAVGHVIGIIASTCDFDFRLADRPETFFSAIREWLPTHIALDLAMPEMDGVQVLGELAAIECNSRIIITSGMGSRVLEAAQRSADEHGLHIIGVLSKPFVAAALRALLLGVQEGNPVAAKHVGRATAISSFETTEAELRRCLEDRELQLVYQPKIECATNNLIGFEALARWRHPVHGIISPDRFIPFAERHGMIDALTEQIIELALQWLAGWQISAAPGQGKLEQDLVVALSLNLSAESLKDPAFVERITSHCSRHQIRPQRLIFELTETSAMEDPIASLDLLTRLRVRGFQLSLDDFGTGYSSMLQLVRMPFTEIKVDKSFVMSAMRSCESRAVITSIVDLARSLGIKSAAEGVEDSQTLDFLRQIGCDLAQGYFISAGLPVDAIDAWISHRAATAGPSSPKLGAQQPLNLI